MVIRPGFCGSSFCTRAVLFAEFLLFCAPAYSLALLPSDCVYVSVCDFVSLMFVLFVEL